ncbi:Dimodular nonribosomal peptide synthase [Streptomyces californicus]
MDAPDLARPVDLAADGALMTQGLFRIGEERGFWCRRVHIAVDAYALSLIGQRVGELYRALAAGEQLPEGRFAPLSELTGQEATYLAGEEYTADRAFWTARMAGASVSVPHRFPRPRGRAAGRTAPPGRRPSRRGARPAVLGGTGREGDLGRAGGGRDRRSSAPDHRRRRRGTGPAADQPAGPGGPADPAMTVNVLPLRIAVRPADTAAELLRRVVLEIREVHRHQRYPQADLRRDLALESAATPLTGPLVNVKPFDGALDFAGPPAPCAISRPAPWRVSPSARPRARTGACGSRWTPRPPRTVRRISRPTRTPGCATWTVSPNCC